MIGVEVEMTEIRTGIETEEEMIKTKERMIGTGIGTEEGAVGVTAEIKAETETEIEIRMIGIETGTKVGVEGVIGAGTETGTGIGIGTIQRETGSDT